MKIQLQLEDPDLQEMVTLYFQDKGFNVKNMPEIVEAFAEAFPEGLKVMAEVITIPPAAKVPEAVPVVIPAEPKVDTPLVRRESTRALSITDLRDPTMTDSFPTRDEQLKQEQDELDRILQRSKDLEEDA